jgi:hypothetical protein
MGLLDVGVGKSETVSKKIRVIKLIMKKVQGYENAFKPGLAL